jgi:hypothetical protein
MKVFAILLGLMFFGPLAVPSPAAERRPNFLFILVDDQSP